MEDNEKGNLNPVATPDEAQNDEPIDTNKVNVLLFFLVVAFGWGSWIDINAIFSQYSMLMSVLPEGTDIGSYLAMLIQIGNIFPILYVIGRKLKPNIFHERPIIIIILATGVGCMLALAFTYDKAVVLSNGSAIGLPVLLICFILAAADTTSTLTFLPYMSLFPYRYLSAFFVGQSLSNFIPGMLAFIQGSTQVTLPPGSRLYPQNSLFCSKTSAPTPPDADVKIMVGKLFSTQVYFGIITLFLLISLLAFFAITFADYFTRKMNKRYHIYIEERKSTHRRLELGSLFNKLRSEWKTIDKPFVCYLVSIAIVSFLNNGIIVQLVPKLYPYGNGKMVFICSNVSLLSSAITSVLLMWKMFRNHWIVMLYTLGLVVLTVSVLVFILLPGHYGVELAKSTYEPLLIVIFILYGHISSSVRQIVCTVAGSCNPERMLICSICIQVGSFFGALCMFIPISVLCVL